MQPTTVELPRDILREAEFLSAHAAQTTCESFLQDEVLKRAFVRSTEIIGQATKKVPEETRLRFPGLEWKKMAGMRERLMVARLCLRNAAHFLQNSGRKVAPLVPPFDNGAG